MKTKRYKTPAGYVAPLRSRAAILAWLSDSPFTDQRGGHNYPATCLFCFNVKLHG
jgi:hypothetical protein